MSDARGWSRRGHGRRGSRAAWWTQFGRSAAVGGLATAVDLGLLWALIDGLGAPPAVANAPALGAGLLVQFLGNKYFAFGARGSEGVSELVVQGAQFAAVEAVAFGLNLLSFHILAVVLGAPFAVARLAGEGVVYLGFSFPAWRRIFSRPSAVDATGGPPER